MVKNTSNHKEISPKGKCGERLNWKRDITPHVPISSEDSTFGIIVKQLGGGAWAESIAREILSEAPTEGEDR